MGTRRKTRMVSMMFLMYLLVALGFIAGSSGFPTPTDDVGYLDREVVLEFPASGAQQMFNWLIYQLRKNELGGPPEPSVNPYRFSEIGRKRNSELTSSIMAIPRAMIDNGRKK